MQGKTLAIASLAAAKRIFGPTFGLALLLGGCRRIELEKLNPREREAFAEIARAFFRALLLPMRLGGVSVSVD